MVADVCFDTTGALVATGSVDQTAKVGLGFMSSGVKGSAFRGLGFRGSGLRV